MIDQALLNDSLGHRDRRHDRGEYVIRKIDTIALQPAHHIPDRLRVVALFDLATNILGQFDGGLPRTESSMTGRWTGRDTSDDRPRRSYSSSDE